MRHADQVDVLVERRAAHGDYAIYLRQEIGAIGSRRFGWALPVVMQEITPESFASAPSPHAMMTTNQAQRLLDDLWRSGLRPTEYHSAGQFEAMRDHIADLRKSHDAMIRSATVKNGEMTID